MLHFIKQFLILKLHVYTNTRSPLLYFKMIHRRQTIFELRALHMENLSRMINAKSRNNELAATSISL